MNVISSEQTKAMGPLGRFLSYSPLLACLVALCGCVETQVLRERSDLLDEKIARLEKENEEFQANYYKINEIMNEELAKAGKEKNRLQRELDKAQTLKSQKERELSDQLRRTRNEFNAFQSEAEESKAIARSEIAARDRKINSLQAEVDAALEKISGLNVKLREEQTLGGELTREVAALKVEKQDLSEQARLLQQDVATRDNAIIAEQAARQEDKKTLGQVIEERGDLVLEISGLEDQVAETLSSLAEKTEALEQSEKQADELQAKLEEIEAFKPTIDKATLDALVTERDGLKEQIETLAAEKEAEMEAFEAQKKVDIETAVQAALPPNLAEDQALGEASDSLRKQLADAPGADGAKAQLDSSGLHIILPTDALFNAGSTIISPEAKALLDPVAGTLKKFSERDIRIEGHTDDRPIGDLPFADHWALGFACADRVRDYLMSEGGIAGGNLKAISRAYFNPIVAGEDDADQALNRRVEIIIGRPVEQPGG